MSEQTELPCGSIMAEWNWARGLSRDLLLALPEALLHQQPLAAAGSWGKQFRHLGRVQENYIQALETGKMRFSPNGCTFTEAITQANLLAYLERLDDALVKGLHPGRIDWFGESLTVERHLQALISHEILHHGQLILYARVAGLKLPESWQAWGE